MTILLSSIVVNLEMISDAGSRSPMHPDTLRHRMQKLAPAPPLQACNLPHTHADISGEE